MHCAVWGKSGGREHKKSSKNGEDSVECAKLLINHGANVNLVDNKNYTPIHLAALTSAPRSLKFLLAIGCNINTKNKYNMTPLHCAIKIGSLDTFNVALESGADLHIKDINGYEAFDFILGYNRTNILNYILKEIKYQEIIKYTKKQFLNKRSLEICIDNNSAEIIEILSSHYTNEIMELITNYNEGFIIRCIAFN